MPTPHSDFQSVQSVSAATRNPPVSPCDKGGNGAKMGNLEITIFERMHELEPAWRRLETDDRCSLHQGYDWCAAWVKTNRKPLALVHGTMRGETAFILPLEITQVRMVRIAQFIGERFSNINTGLFSTAFLDAHESQDFAAVMDTVSQLLAGRVDLISMRNVPFDWRGRVSPLARLPAIENQNRAFQLTLHADFNETLSQLNTKKRLKRYRSQTRKLDAVGGYDHVIAIKEQDRHDLVEQFFRQKGDRFRERGLPNVFHAPEIQRFFHLLLESDVADRDVPLQMHALRLRGEYGGHIAAMAGLSRKGDHIICQFGSIDDTVLPEASPGDLLFWLMIEQACSAGAALFDFGIGDQIYKRAWCTEETVHHDIHIPVSSLGRLAASAQRGLTRTKIAIKRKPQVYALIQRLRAFANRDGIST